MVSPPESSTFPEHHPVQSSGEDARAFLQERLAFLGKAYGLIGLGFSFAGNLVSAPLRVLSGLTEDWSSRIALVGIAIYLLQWLLCRRGRWSESALRLLDATSTTLVALVNAAMVFATFPGELPGLSYARALLDVHLGARAPGRHRAQLRAPDARAGPARGCFPVGSHAHVVLEAGAATIPPGSCRRSGRRSGAWARW